VDYVGLYCEKVGEEGKKDFNHPSNQITNLKKTLDPPLTNDDVVPSEVTTFGLHFMMTLMIGNK
jgi:hypothetical protein